MSEKRDEGGDPHFRGATPEALARALLRPLNRPSAGQPQTDSKEAAAPPLDARLHDPDVPP